jgi:hypothetical protein
MEEYNVVHQILGKEGSVQLRTALQQKAQNLPLSERTKYRIEIEPPTPLCNARDLDARRLDLGNAIRICARATEDQQITMRRAHKLRVERDAQARVKDHAQQRTSSRKF